MKTETEPKGSCSGCRWLFKATVTKPLKGPADGYGLMCAMNRQAMAYVRTYRIHYETQYVDPDYAAPKLWGVASRCELYDTRPPDTPNARVAGPEYFIEGKEAEHEQHFLQTGDPMPLLMYRVIGHDY